MLSYNVTYETYRDYVIRMRKWERQAAYERGIVRSVPPMHIAVSSIEPPVFERWEPG